MHGLRKYIRYIYIYISGCAGYVSRTTHKLKNRPETATRPPPPPDICVYVLRKYIRYIYKYTVALVSIGSNDVKHASHCVSYETTRVPIVFVAAVAAAGGRVRSFAGGGEP